MNFFKNLFRKHEQTPEVPAEITPAREAPATEEVLPVIEEEPPLLTAGYEVYAQCVSLSEAVDALRPAMVSRFRTLSESGDGFSGTLIDGADVEVRISAEESYVDTLTRRFACVSTEKKDVYTSALMQIALFNIQLTIDSSAKTAEKLAHAEELAYALAEALDGFIASEPSRLYRYDRKLLVSEDGTSDFDEFAPVAVVPEPVDPNEERRSASLSEIAVHGIESVCDAPVQLRAEDAHIRPCEQILNRAAALYACVLIAKAHTTREYPNPAAYAQTVLNAMEAQYGIKSEFTPKEAQYALRPQNHASMLTRSEACATLLWALGLVELPWPSKKTNIDALSDVLKNSDAQRLPYRVNMRPMEEILRLQDVTFRLHSICLRCDVSEYGLDADAIYERHYALNWLLGVGGIADWDNVIPKT